MNRTINLYQAVALYISAILGSGILFLTSQTASVAGPASTLSWLIVILFSFPLAYTFAAMSRLHPDAGGAATFVRMAFGEHPGNLVGWFYFLTAAVGQIIVSLTGAGYIGSTFQLSRWETAALACLILLIAGISNHCGIQISGKISLLLSSILLVLLLMVVISTLPFIEWGNFQPFLPHGWPSVGVALTLVFWSFFGWEAICSLADRFQQPERDLIRSAMFSGIIIGILFLLLSFVTIGSGTYGSLTKDTSPLGEMMHHSLGFGARLITALLAFIICTGTTNAFVASLGQLGYALSRDGAFPRWLQKTHPRTGTAVRVVWLVILFAGAGVLVTTLLSVPFTRLLFIPNSLGMVVYLISMAAACKLFPERSGPWVSGGISLVFLFLFLPFLGLNILVPAGVGSIYFLYVKWRKPNGTDSITKEREAGGMSTTHH